jgi:hypothetical protein
MRGILTSLGCLILLILFLPIIAIVIGPLLVLAALRGHQPAGPITLNTERYGPAGRMGGLMLGLAVWILVWGGLAWLAIAGGLIEQAMATISPPNVTAPVTNSVPTSPTIPPTLTPPATDRPVLLPSATATPVTTSTVPTMTDTATPIPTATATQPADDLPATNTPMSLPEAEQVAEATITVIPAAPAPTLTIADRQTAIAVVEEGNILLREATALANEENIQSLQTVWQGLGLTVATDFATKLYERYAKPFDVEFEYITLPKVEEQSSPDEVIVTSRERWSYVGPTKRDEEAFEFSYTLNRQDGRWVITRYTYRNLPFPTPTTIPTRTLTPAG